MATMSIASSAAATSASATTASLSLPESNTFSFATLPEATVASPSRSLWNFDNPFTQHSLSSTVSVTKQPTPTANPHSFSSPMLYPPTPNLQSQITIKLDSTNYVLWKAQVLSAVRGSGLAQHVDSRMQPPAQFLAPGVDNPVFTMWYQKNQQVLSWILGSVSISLLPHIASASSALEAWTKLDRAYASGARSRVVNLKDELGALKQGNDDITTYVLKARSIYDQLASYQSIMSDDDFNDALFLGLHENYSHFIRTIRVQNTTIEFDHLFGLLLHEERQLSRIKSPAIIESTALYSVGQNSGYSGQRGRGRNRGRNQSRGSGRTQYNNYRGSEQQPRFHNSGQHSIGLKMLILIMLFQHIRQMAENTSLVTIVMG